MALFTYQDAVDSLTGYLGAAPSDQVVQDCRQAIMEASLDIVNAHNWSYYYKFGRINCNAPQGTGSVQYWVSDGAYPYQMTLTGATWPTWAADGYLFINATVYRVDQLIDAQNITLSPDLAPTADLAAGTGYQIYQDSYELPADFVSQDQSLYETVFGSLQYVHPRDWLFSHRYIYNVGIPRMYCIDADTKYMNRLVVRLAPIPDANQTLDFIYKRRMRPLLWQNVSSGLIAVASGTSLVTGTMTSFDSTMTGSEPGQGGSVLRIAAASQSSSKKFSYPTWSPGPFPAVFEGQVYSVASPTSLNLMPLTPSTLTGSSLSYILSDPIDIETGSMLSAFLRLCEHKISQHRIMKDKPSARLQYIEALTKAREADSRSFAARAEGDVNWNRQMMKDMPMGPDLPLGIG